MEFRSARGRVLSRVGFDPIFEEERLGRAARRVAVNVAPFSITTDLPPGTASIALRQGDRLLTEVSRSPNRPTVAITAIVVNKETAREETVDVSWNGEDLDGDSLIYTVFYTPDGEDFHLLAVDTPETTLRFRLSDVPAPQAGATIEVRANDGFNTAVVASPFIFAPNIVIDPPIVRLVRCPWTPGGCRSSQSTTPGQQL